MPDICGAISTFCIEDQCWTYTCQAADGHAPGDHDYVIDAGQGPDPIPQEG